MHSIPLCISMCPNKQTCVLKLHTDTHTGSGFKIKWNICYIMRMFCSCINQQSVLQTPLFHISLSLSLSLSLCLPLSFVLYSSLSAYSAEGCVQIRDWFLHISHLDSPLGVRGRRRKRRRRRQRRGCGWRRLSQTKPVNYVHTLTQTKSQSL